MIEPWAVASNAVDANGVATFDLDSTGRAMDMLQKLTKYYEGGGETIEKVRVIIAAAPSSEPGA